MQWVLRRIKKRKKRRSTVTVHFKEHKEMARVLVHQKLQHWNTFYNLKYNRVAIRNSRRNWGSCTSLKNLNFNYKILFLPSHLQDYIIVHELCHLQELNHKDSFWVLVAKHIPEYQACITELKSIEQQGLRTIPALPVEVT